MTLSPGNPAVIGTTIGPYQILAELGRGGMGEVYRARDTRLNRDVAIKILPDALAADADRLARFTREAQVLAALNHQNIAAIYGIEKTSGVVSGTALVMELVEGEDLSAAIARGPLTWADALPIARQIADALEVAHEAGIIHRDLKPANIKVRSDGTVKVLDFGLAKALVSDGAGSDTLNSPTMTARATQLGMVLGTAAYMAPEQARGKAVDRRADIWAFGVVLFEMLTGQRAFEGDDVSITLANVLKEDVHWNRLPPDLPASAHRLLKRSLEKDPKRRLSSIGDARLELDDSTALPVIASAAHRRSLALPWALAAVTTLAAIYLGWLALGRTNASSNPIWTSIPAPVDGFSRGMGPAVSPDGKWIVFGAPDAKGQDHLWIRGFGAQLAQILPGTESGASPFWSPDSKFIAFIKDRKLQTIPAAGGTPQVLADTAGNSRGGTWNQDGVVLFVPAPGLGLQRVSASAGGAAVALAAFADPPGALTMYPSFLPDGQHFLFTRVSDSESWINVGSLADGTTTKLLPAFSRAAYVAGYLVFGGKGGLYAQPFDPATLTLSGERTRIVEFAGGHSGHTVNYGFSASADGGILAAGNKPYLPLSQLVWFDRTGARLGPLCESAHLFGLSVAPDRARVAIEKLDPRLNSIDPWIVDVKTGFSSPLRASVEGLLASSPTWSHDNKALFHSSGHGTLRVSSLTGGKDDAWTIGANWPITSAPDGSVLLISQQGTNTSGDVMVVSITGDHTPKPYLQTPFDESQPRFSPNGKLVAYVSNESGRNEIYIQSFPRSLLKIPVSTAGGTHPEWNQDGSELYFSHDEPDGTRSLMSAKITADSAAPAQKLFGGITGFWEANRTGFGVFDNGRRFLMSVLVPVTAPQVITVGHNWMAGLPPRR
jgi:serine/threonine protein kinase